MDHQSKANRRIKVLLLLSFILNLMFFIVAGVAIQQRGGVGYLVQKGQSFLGVQTELSMENRSPDYLRRLSVYETLPVDDQSVVFLGDSIIAGIDWAELMDNKRFLNRGIPGDDSAGVIDRLEEVLNNSPEKVVMMFGVNDLHNDGNNKTLLENYREIIKTSKDISPETEIYIHSILPYNTKKYALAETTNMTNSLIVETNEELSNIAEESHVEYIDLHSFLAGENGELQEEFTFDGLHLSGEAYIIWGEELQKFLK